MKILPFLFIGFFALLLFSCETNDQEISAITTLEEMDSPCIEGGEPNLFVSENGAIYLSWIEYLNDTTDALVFSILENKKWTIPKTIATGSDWFVNWADFPSIVSTGKDGKYLAAHWLQKSANGSYDYDVQIAQSHDGGQNWHSPFIPHRDSIAAEHGFVSMLPLSNEKIFATWLDGRNTKDESKDTKDDDHEDGDHGHGHHGAMTLRTAVFDKNGNLSQEAELDNRICDCCQTAAVKTEEGIIVAYRDRSEKEVRDISVVRKVNGKWTPPKSVSNDNWMIAGCPVNGPALDANGKQVVLAWFTMSDEKPQVKIAFSNDNGANFGKPIRIDEGNPLGRVDVVMISKDKVLVSWMEKQEEGAAVKIIQVNQESIIGSPSTITASKASRQSGFPRMVKNGNQIVFAWTQVEGKVTKVKTAIMGLD